jgi:hypothetical protein
MKLGIIKISTRTSENRVYGFHDELMMEESGCVSEI